MNVYLKDQINHRSTNINILRFACAIAVILCHSYAVTLGEADFFSRFTRGQCNLGGVAVAVFFFLSGLYVTKSLDKTDSIPQFMIRRCRRIFPQLWMVVLLSIIMGALITAYPIGRYLTSVGTYKYLLNGVFVPVHNLPGVFEGIPYGTVNGSLWTLPVEFACYIGLAMISFFSARVTKGAVSRRKFYILALAVLAVAFALVWIRMPDSMLASILRPMVIFFEGALYYEYRDKIRLNPVIAAGALIAFILLGFTPLFNLGLIVLFPYCVLGLTLGLPQCGRDIGLWSYSYEMYLVGWPIQQVVMMLSGGMAPLANWLITVPIDILLAWVVFSATERIMKKV